MSTGSRSFWPTELQADPAPGVGSAPLQGSALGSEQDALPSPSCPISVSMRAVPPVLLPLVKL